MSNPAVTELRRSEQRASADVAWLAPSANSADTPIATVAEQYGVALAPSRLSVSLTATDDGSWIADQRDLGQYGEGATPQEAFEDLMSTLREYRDLLYERRHRISKKLKGELKTLQQLFPARADPPVPLEKRKLLKALTSKLGGELIDDRDHVWVTFSINNTIVAATKYSRSAGKEISDPGLIARIAKQIGLSASQLQLVVGCQMDAPEFYANLEQRGV